MRIVLLCLVLTLASGCGIFSGLKGSSPKDKSEGYTGPVHQKHTGKVVFSKAPIPRAPVDDSAFETSFTLKDDLYLRPYLDASPQILLASQGQCTTGSWTLTASVNGSDPERIASDSLNPMEFDRLQTWPPSEDEKHFYLTRPETKRFSTARTMVGQFNAVVLPQLKVGSNQVRFDVQVECWVPGDKKKKTKGFRPSAVVASGVAEIEVGATSVADYLKRVVPALPDDKLPKGSGSALRADMKAEAAKFFAKTEDGRYGKVVAIRAYEDDWTVVRHKISGRILRRIVKALVVTSAPSDKYCHVHFGSFRQEATLKGSFAKAVDLYVGPSGRYPCAIVGR